MNSAISHAIHEIKKAIPSEILSMVSDRKRSLEYNIRENIIYGIVFKSCNVTGGKTTQIILQQNWLKNHRDNPFGIFEVPPIARENRDIIEVHAITKKVLGSGSLGGMDSFYPLHNLYTSGFMDSVGSIGVAADRMLQSKTGAYPFSQDPLAEVLDGNIIMIHPAPMNYTEWCLSCRLAYDSEMNNLNSAAVLKFGALAVVAAKQHCYRELVIKIDMGQVEFGINIQSIKDIISGWSSLDEDYNEALRKFTGSTVLDVRRLPTLLHQML